MGKVLVSTFLKAREDKYKPGDKELKGLKRLNKIDFDGIIHLSDKPTKTDMIIVNPGDLVISGINVAKGAVAVYEGDEPITATIHYSSYIFDEKKINIEFFKRFLKSPVFIDLLKEQVKSGIKTEIKAKKMLALEVDIPEIEKQRRTNNHFESFEEEFKTIDFEMDNQERILGKLRQAIIQEAIEGKLNADWRKDNPIRKGDPDYDAEALLEKIRDEKEKLIKEGKIKKQKPFTPIVANEMPFELPKGWVQCRVGELIKELSTGPFGTMLHKSDYVKQGIPIVNPMNIIGDKIIADERMLISEKTKSRLDHYSLSEGDLVIARRGNLSKCAVVDKQQHGWLCGTGSFFLRTQFTNNTFFRLVYTCERSQKYLLQDSIGQTMDNLNQGLLIKLPLGLPSLKEQNFIVEQVDSLMKIVDDIEAHVLARKFQSAQLMQTVLREAFNA